MHSLKHLQPFESRLHTPSALSRLHQVCEACYELLCELQITRDSGFLRSFPCGGYLHAKFLDHAGYTSSIRIRSTLVLSKSWSLYFITQVRLYHDVRMAEVIRLEAGNICVRTSELYRHPVEKCQLNHFLHDWLTHAHTLDSANTT